MPLVVRERKIMLLLVYLQLILLSLVVGIKMETYLKTSMSRRML